ncbi:MAG: DUF5666 domain-containing protein [Omnitrophica WOR_2 bacterium]
MSKKIFIPIIIVLVLAFAGGSVVYAAQGMQAPDNLPVKVVDELSEGGRGIAQVTVVGNNQFTVKTKKGEKTLLVDANTRLFAINGSIAAFSDLKPGEWVIGSYHLNQQGALVARNVILLPQGFDPALINRRIAGRITEVNPGASTFVLHTRKGENLTISVNTTTVFLGKVQNLSKMKPGMLVTAGAREENGKLVALLLWARVPALRYAGKITAIDTAAGSFVLQTRAGKQLTFLVNENTHFRSFGKAVKGLSDLKVGMVAIVIARSQGGNLLATGVAAANLVQN